MITRGEEAQLSTRGPHALTGGPSVQVQFPHLKISTLTTGKRYTGGLIHWSTVLLYFTIGFFLLEIEYFV